MTYLSHAHKLDYLLSFLIISYTYSCFLSSVCICQCVGTFQEARLALILTLGRYRGEEIEEKKQIETRKEEEIEIEIGLDEAENGGEQIERNIIKSDSQIANVIGDSDSVKDQNLPIVLEALKSCVGDFNFNSELDPGSHAESSTDSIFNFHSDFKILLAAMQKDKDKEVEKEIEIEVETVSS